MPIILEVGSKLMEMRKEKRFLSSNIFQKTKQQKNKIKKAKDYLSPFLVLFRYVNSSCFSNNGNLHLTRVSHFGLDFL